MKQRIITGVIGAILVIIALFTRETFILNLLVGAVLVVAMFESQHATNLVKNNKFIILNCIFAFISAFIPLFGFIPTGLLITAIYIFAVVLLILANPKTMGLYQTFYGVGITLITSFGLSSILYINSLYRSKDYMYLSSDCLFLLLFVLGGAWFSDIGAYFIGSKYGKHKIAPVISPKKSLEGVLGGILSTIVCELLIAAFWSLFILDDNSYIQYGWLILLAALCPLVGLVGDLFYSYIKRTVDLKDFGNIMPGHGGFLDRVDSLIFVAPFVSIMLMYFPIIVHK